MGRQQASGHFGHSDSSAYASVRGYFKSLKGAGWMAFANGASQSGFFQGASWTKVNQ